MPGQLLHSLAEMVPRLQAEETLAMANAVALGSGTLRKHDATKFRRQLERDARGPRRRGQRAASMDEHLQRVRALGFQVEVNGD